MSSADSDAAQEAAGQLKQDAASLTGDDQLKKSGQNDKMDVAGERRAQQQPDDTSGFVSQDDVKDQVKDQAGN